MTASKPYKKPHECSSPAHTFTSTSSSFDASARTDWQLAVAQPCPAADAIVHEWERRTPQRDHLMIEKAFRAGEVTLATVEERWAHLGSLHLNDALERAGFEAVHVDRGYGTNASTHRSIYHARRKGHTTHIPNGFRVIAVRLSPVASPNI
jgi:hypothetical protein